MLKISELKKSFWPKVIFDWVSLTIPKWIKWWIVWINGAWKSTLFQILSWTDKDYEWEIVFDTKEPLIWYMHQQISISDQNMSMYDFLKSYTWVLDIETRVFELMENLNTQENIDKYWEVYEMFEKLWWYEFESRASTLLNNLWLWKYDIYSTIIKNLSGWEKNKLLLCATLLKGGDLLLLDEPTNNLDDNSINWLILYIKEILATCLVITHDKKFLNSVARKVYEVLDWGINEFTWDYEFYERQKILQYNRQLDEYYRQQEKFKRAEKTKIELISKASTIANKWNIRDNDKWDWSSKVAKKLSKQAKNIKTRIEKMEKIEKPKERTPLSITLEIDSIPEGWIYFENITYMYEKWWLEIKVCKFEIWSKDKLLILWENWQGKTTFAKILAGIICPDNWIININKSINIWYFSQENIDMPLERSCIEYLESKWNFLFEEINYVLWSVWIEEDDRHKAIKLLSPGMVIKLRLALLMLNRYNCIIFDEPTNHVDVETRKQLEAAINDFKWIILVISHDQTFIDNINFNRKIYFKDWKIEE